MATAAQDRSPTYQATVSGKRWLSRREECLVIRDPVQITVNSSIHGIDIFSEASTMHAHPQLVRSESGE